LTVEGQKQLARYAELIKEKRELVRVDNIPPAESLGKGGLVISVSDDLEYVEYYEVLDDSGARRDDGTIDTGKMKLKSLARVKTFHLVYPDKYLEKELDAAAYAKLNALFTSGAKYTLFRGVVTSHDGRVDMDTWSANADTLFLHKVLEGSGMFNMSGVKTFAEVGAGTGHNALAALKNYTELEKLVVTDVSLYSLMAAKRNLMPYMAGKNVSLETWLGKGIKKLGNDIDVMLINPPYLPAAPWDMGLSGQGEDPYKSTGLMKEIIAEGVRHLNPENPEAAIVMNYSSLAQDDFMEYKRAYGKLVDIDVLSEGHMVPLKVENADKRWLDWMKDKGLIVREKTPEGGFKYWHRLNVVRIKPKKIGLRYENGEQKSFFLHDLARTDTSDWEGLTMSSKLMVLALTDADPVRLKLAGNDWIRLHKLLFYYKRNLPALKGKIETHLERAVEISPSDMIMSLVELSEGFSSGNILKAIYFSGRNPHLTNEVVEAYRGLMNEMPFAVKETLLEVFAGNIGILNWDRGIASYLKDAFGYEGVFKLVDVRDFSVGNGVYKLRIEMPGSADTRFTEFFLKRQHKGHGDLRNEVAYLECERALLGGVNLPAKPFYFTNPDAARPDMLITPVIKEESLDSGLTRTFLSLGRWEQRVFPEEEFKLDVKKNLWEIQVYFDRINDVSASEEERLSAVESLRSYEADIVRDSGINGHADYHSHTMYSDGADTPAALVFKAWVKGMKAVAVTDHMSFDGITEAVKAAKILGGIEILPGMEIYSRDKSLNIDSLHVIVYLPLIKSLADWEFVRKMMDANDEYQKMREIQGNRQHNLRLVVDEFNRQFAPQGVEVTWEDLGRIPHKMLTLRMISEFCFKKYGAEKLGVSSAEELKQKYFNYARKHVFPRGVNFVDLNTVFGFSDAVGGITSVAHPMRSLGASGIRAVQKLKKLLLKYSRVEIGERMRPGLQAIGLWGGGNDESTDLLLREMMLELSREDAFFAKYPVIPINESDYHGVNDRTLLTGTREKSGRGSIPPDVAVYSRLLDLRDRAESASAVPDFNDSAIMAAKTRKGKDTRLLEDVVFSLAAHAALGDILGRNDRKLSNTRIDLDGSGALKGLVDFDIANMLDPGDSGEEGWRVNYEWILEDVKQGISELTLVSQLDEYRKDEGKKPYHARLKSRTALMRMWASRYIAKWKEISREDNVKMISETIRKTWALSPGEGERKIAVLERWIKTDPFEFVEKLIRAQLEDNEIRKLYRDTLREIRDKKGAQAIGYLNKYIHEEDTELLSARSEVFRGLLSKDFLDRMGIKGRKPIEEVYREIEKLADTCLGGQAGRAVRNKALTIKREAGYVVDNLFAGANESEEEFSTADNALDMVFSNIYSKGRIVILVDPGLGNCQAVPPLSALDLERIVPEDLNGKIEIRYTRPGDMRGEVESITAHGGAHIFVFAGTEGNVGLLDLAARSDVDLSVIDDADLPKRAYYPIVEIIASTLSRRLLGYDVVLKDLEDMGLTREDINLDQIFKKGDILTYRLLPSAREFKSEKMLTGKYSRLRRFLIAV
jgi:predicted metal-dependent phosphoesterase TrpH/methylase of polypeptide subunit release factors